MIVRRGCIRELLGIFIVVHEEVKVDYAGYAHEPGLQSYEDNAVHAQPPENTVIFPAHAEKEPIPYEVENGQGHTEGVTHISGTKPEAGFQFILLLAHRAFFVHIENLRKTQLERVLVSEHVAPPAMRAFHFKDTEEVIRFIAHGGAKIQLISGCTDDGGHHAGWASVVFLSPICWRHMA